MDKVEILEQEQKLQFGAFTHDVGLEIALRVIKKVKEQAPKACRHTHRSQWIC